MMYENCSMTPPKKTKELFALDPCGGNFFPFLTEHAIEGTHYFGRGFQDGGDILVQEYRRGGDPDYAALPVVFLFRHAAELYLKSIIWNGDELLEFLKKTTSGAGNVAFTSHSLTQLLPFAEKIKAALGLTWNEIECGPYVDAVQLLNEFDAVDPNSFAFRYPVDTAGNATKHHEWGFNLIAFAEPTSKALNGWWDLALDVEGLREQLLSLP